MTMKKPEYEFVRGTDSTKGPGSDPKVRFSIAVKLILIILAVSVIPILIVSLSGMFSVHSVSNIAEETGEEIARSSVNDSGSALEAELVRSLRLQTISLGESIDQILHQVSSDTTKIRDYANFLYANSDRFKKYPYPSTYRSTKNGVFGSVEPNNNSWLMASELGLNPDHTVPEKLLDEIYLTEWMDLIFQTVAENDPYAVQVYLNTKSQLTRGMPFVNGTYQWVDATSQFEPDMNLSEYDFFYLADGEHNPARKTVWTQLYYDPAGLGWMISSVSPVYLDNSFKGVVGIDITLRHIIATILNVTIEKTGFAFLIANDGKAIAFPERAAHFLGYSGNLSGSFGRDEQFRYNLSENPDPVFRSIIHNMTAGGNGVVRYLHPDDNIEFFVAYAPINETGWSVGVVTQVIEVTRPSQEISRRIHASMNQSYERISTQINGLILNNFIIILLILIGMIPTAFILTRMISRPINVLIEGSSRIGAGDLTHRIEIASHDELEVLADTFNIMAFELDQKMNQIEDANRELRRMDELKSQFISIASHELRTPLIAIKGYIDMLLSPEGESISEKQRKMLEVVSRNTSRLGRIISEILDMSRIEADKLVLVNEWFSLGDLIHEVGEELRSSMEKRGHTFILEIENDLSFINGDRDRFTQVIINLLGNAIKYTPDNGKITVRAYQDGPSLHMEVSDTGIGIREEDIPHIFTRFYQGTAVSSHRTGKDEFLAGGTGLGLSIVKGIVQAHHGTISVTSVLGKGTTFHVILPTSDGSGRPYESGPENEVNVEVFKKIQEKGDDLFIGLRILIIDDEPDTLELFSDILSPRYQIITANSGATGLKRAIADLPNLILLDAWMPGITGFDVCRTLKKNQRTANIPIIIVTAAVGEERKTQSKDAGADALLFKPFEINTLLSMVEKWIQKRET